MEQVHCWVWLNSKKEQIFKYSSPSSTMNSPTLMSNSSSTTWEEKAFAEDAAGHGPLGGCIWPPRSYSCSFCMREFRSAQALGGHMNVHRRDRARLKHCLNPNTAAATAITTVTATTTHLDPTSHSISSHSFVNASSISCPFSTLSPSRAPSSALIISSTHQKENSSISGTTEQAFRSSRSDSKPDLHHQIENNMALIREEDSIVCQLVGNDSDDGDEYNVETDLSVGLNISVVSRNRSAQGGCCGEDASNYKRPKVSSSFPCFLQAEVTGLVATSMEDNSLDLELRLGDPPKVK